jgi:N-acetyl sugar amidotransferase
MKYCSKCWMPDTKPYVSFDPYGVCGACKAHESKQKAVGGIDWSKRNDEFQALIAEIKSLKAPFYDVLVPVSGGKDSLTQVHRLLNHDLRILAVHVDYGIKTEIGDHNLDLVPNMGANLIIYRPSQSLHRRIIKLGFLDHGDPDLLSHTLLHAYPLRVALQFKVPLVWLGENSAFEYGGVEALSSSRSITREWFSKYAANKEMDANFVAKKYDIPYKDLIAYDFPDEIEESTTTRAEFMSYYFFWDSEIHLKIAEKHGFKSLPYPSEGTYRSYVGIDEKINRIHQYFKVLKFGYGRATDHACEDIRNGRLTRTEAKVLIQEHDLKDISDYYLNDFIEYIDITRKEFFNTVDRFRNNKIWELDCDGNWYIPGHLED